MNYKVEATAINIARAIYALNWFDIAPSLIFISKDLKLRLIYLGIATTSFFIGLAIFQMVGGLFSSRYGSRLISFVGMMILGIGNIFSGFSFNLIELAIFRFIAGSGTAIFFSPGLSLLKSVTPAEKYGFWVGVYNSSFNLGGGIGAFGWVPVDDIIGWRAGLILGGALAIISGIAMYLLTKDYKFYFHDRQNFGTKIKSVFRNEQLWYLSLGLFAGILSESIIGQFIIFYSETYINLNHALSGLIGGGYLILGFPGGILGGYIISKFGVKKSFSISLMYIISLLFIPIALTSNFYIFSISVLIEGFITVNSFSLLYTLTVYYLKEESLLPFALSFVNSIQIALSSVIPTIFTAIASFYSYRLSWIFLSLLGFAFTFFLFFNQNRN